MTAKEASAARVRSLKNRINKGRRRGGTVNQHQGQTECGEQRGGGEERTANPADTAVAEARQWEIGPPPQAGQKRGCRPKRRSPEEHHGEGHGVEGQETAEPASGTVPSRVGFEKPGAAAAGERVRD